MDTTFQRLLHAPLREQHILQHKELAEIVTMRMLLLIMDQVKVVRMLLMTIAMDLLTKGAMKQMLRATFSQLQ